MVKECRHDTDGYLKYWEANVEKWGNLYHSASHSGEKLQAPGWLSWLYLRTAGLCEAALMKRRYALTMDYISKLEPGTHLLDIGCGTGIFTVQALIRGCRVTAVDFAEAALAATRSAAERACPGAMGRLELFNLDVRKDAIPAADHVLLVGVLPYIDDPAFLLDQVARSARTALIQFNDAGHWANRTRTVISSLNVRRLEFHRLDSIAARLSRKGWVLTSKTRFATGYMLVAQKGGRT